MSGHIQTKRAYDEPAAADGKRYLVDALWPRGLKKESLKLDGWIKEVAPSRELRQRFHHDPNKWQEFRRRYFAELDSKPESWAALAKTAQKSSVTLVYGARDTDHNNAIALSEYLKRHVAAAGHRKTSKHSAGA